MVVSYQSDVERSNLNDVEVAPILCSIFGGDDYEVVEDRDRQVQGIDIVIFKGDRQILIDTKHPSSRRGFDEVIVPWKRTIYYADGAVVSRPQDFFNDRAKTQALVKCFKSGDTWNFHVIDFPRAKSFFILNRDKIVQHFPSNEISQKRGNASQITMMSRIPVAALAEEIPVKTITRNV